MNLLNYFNTFDGLPDPVDNCTCGVGGAPTDCRGADTQAEFDRQWPRPSRPSSAIDADVIGINEIENDGYGPTSAIADLVDQLNAATAPGHLRLHRRRRRAPVRSTRSAPTRSRSGMIYKPAAVTPVGRTAVLNTVAFVNGGDNGPRNRPSLAQAFAAQRDRWRRSSPTSTTSRPRARRATPRTPVTGRATATRSAPRAADALADWLATDPTGTGDQDVLLVGDYNSYAKEDPIATLEAAGFTNLVADQYRAPTPTPTSSTASGATSTTRSASPSIRSPGDRVSLSTTSTPTSRRCSTTTPTSRRPACSRRLYAPDEFRVSDHDPVVVGLVARTVPRPRGVDGRVRRQLGLVRHGRLDASR